MNRKSRRQFVKKLAVFLGLLFLAPLIRVGKFAFGKSEDAERLIAQEFFSNPEEIKVFAEAYLKISPYDRNSFSQKFLKEFNLDKNTLSIVGADVFREKVTESIRADYQNHRLVSLNHWFVSQSEAKFYTWAFLVMGPEKKRTENLY